VDAARSKLAPAAAALAAAARSRLALAAAVFAAAAACSAPATLGDLTVAEQRADAGDVDGAVAAYRRAQETCKRLRPPRRARAACAEALLGEPEVLERAGRTRQALDAYLAVPARAEGAPEPAAIATYRAGGLLLRAGEVRPAWTALWRVVTDWPDEPTAGDALRALLVDGRGRDPRALAEELGKLLTALAGSAVGDNLVWTLADLNEHELANPQAARALYDQIPTDYPDSGLRDDARWHAARISRALGDPAGAAARLRALLKTREVALGAGSYFSVWLDDAQLELGRVLRDELRDFEGAEAAFRRLPRDYPASILQDDALYELAVTQDRAGAHARACETLAALAKQAPDSKYVARGKELCP